MIKLFSALLLSLIANSAFATPVSINNASFESQVLSDGKYVIGIAGWSNTSGGVFNASAAQFPGGVPDGQNFAWLNGGSAGQTLTANLTSNSEYTLSVGVGERLDSYPFPGYSVSLLAGGHVLATESSLNPPAGSFLTSTLHFTALSGNPYLGQSLAILLTANGTQVEFDNVRLDVSPVPEPETYGMMLMGLGLMGFVARRRKQA
jgi:hypothetical protein